MISVTRASMEWFLGRRKFSETYRIPQSWVSVRSLERIASSLSDRCHSLMILGVDIDGTGIVGYC